MYIGHRAEHRTYLEYFQSRALNFFSNAARVGNHLTGVTTFVKLEGEIALKLSDDYQFVESVILIRKSLKVKFVRLSAHSNDVFVNIDQTNEKREAVELRTSSDSNTRS